MFSSSSSIWGGTFSSSSSIRTSSPSSSIRVSSTSSSVRASSPSSSVRTSSPSSSIWMYNNPLHLLSFNNAAFQRLSCGYDEIDDSGVLRSKKSPSEVVSAFLSSRSQLLDSLMKQQKVNIKVLLLFTVPHIAIFLRSDAAKYSLTSTTLRLSLVGTTLGLVSATTWLVFVRAMKNTDVTRMSIHDIQRLTISQPWMLLSVPIVWTIWAFLFLSASVIVLLFHLQLWSWPLSPFYDYAIRIAITSVVLLGSLCQVTMLVALKRYMEAVQ